MNSSISSLRIVWSLRWSPLLQPRPRDLVVYLLSLVRNLCIPWLVLINIEWMETIRTAVFVWLRWRFEKSSRPLVRLHLVHFISCRLWGLQVLQRGYLIGTLELRWFLATDSLYFLMEVSENRATSNCLRQLSHLTLLLRLSFVSSIAKHNLLLHLERTLELLDVLHIKQCS